MNIQFKQLAAFIVERTGFSLGLSFPNPSKISDKPSLTNFNFLQARKNFQSSVDLSPIHVLPKLPCEGRKSKLIITDKAAFLSWKGWTQIYTKVPSQTWQAIYVVSHNQVWSICIRNLLPVDRFQTRSLAYSTLTQLQCANATSWAERLHLCKIVRHCSQKTYPNLFLFKQLGLAGYSSQLCTISTQLLKCEASLKEISCYFYSGLARQLTPTDGSL